MTQGPRFKRVFRLPGRKGRVQREVDEELAFHVDMRVQDLLEEGLSPTEAEAEALRQFGDVAEVRRACRRIGIRREGEMRLVDSWDRLKQDVRFALRQFVKTPLISALAALTLAVGIGAGTVVFTVVDAVVLDAMPFPDADELFALEEVTPRQDQFSVSEPNYLDWRSRQQSFVDIGAYTGGGRTLISPDGTERIAGLRVSHSLFDVLGLVTVVGRTFTEQEDGAGRPAAVVVLAESFWRERYGADPGVLGTSLVLDSRAHEVIGVVASDRGFPGTELFTPLGASSFTDRGNHMLAVAGRLAPGVTEDQARRDMVSIAARLADEYAVNSGWSADIEPLRVEMIGAGTVQMGRFLLGAVGLLLLMACGSVSNILIARATGRAQELSLRVALGAGRRRIVRQLVTESAVLGVIGAGAGVLLAWAGTPVVRALGPGDLERLGQATMDARVLTFAALATFSSVLVFGVLPALLVARKGLSARLRERSPTATGRRVRDFLVAFQFALAIVVVLGAGLTVRSFDRVQSVDLGFEPAGALRFDISVPDGQFAEAERAILLERVADAVEALPGVEAVGLTMSPPFGNFRAANSVAAADDMPDRQEEFLPVSWRAVSGGYFPAAGIDMVAGRYFGPGDGWPGQEEPEGWQPSVVIDVTLARALWNSVDVVGREIVWGDPDGSVMRVIGVSATARDEEVAADPRPRIYVHYDWFPWPEPSFMVRAGAEVGALAPAIRDIVREADPSVPVSRVVTMPETLRNAIAWPRFIMQVLSAFGLVAILLAAMGIYGVTAFNVERRRREMGVRIALGAQPGRVLRVVMRGGARIAVLGVITGVVVALSAARYIEDLLFEVGAFDPITWVVVPIGLLAVAALATWVPARRATRVDPREALAAE